MSSKSSTFGILGKKKKILAKEHALLEINAEGILLHEFNEILARAHTFVPKPVIIGAHLLETYIVHTFLKTINHLPCADLPPHLSWSVGWLSHTMI